MRSVIVPASFQKFDDMSYKWRKEEWESELGEDERFIDWSYLVEPKLTLIVLLTNKGKLSPPSLC